MANAKKLVKPNELRGQIFDKLAEAYGNSVLGMYEGKLRIELIDDAGEIIQFSLAPVIHKTLVEASECDKLVPIAEQLANYEAEKAAKDADTESKKNKDKGKGKGKDKENFEGDTDKKVETPAVPSTPTAPIEVSEEEQRKLDELSAALAGGTF